MICSYAQGLNHRQSNFKRPVNDMQLCTRFESQVGKNQRPVNDMQLCARFESQVGKNQRPVNDMQLRTRFKSQVVNQLMICSYAQGLN